MNEQKRSLFDVLRKNVEKEKIRRRKITRCMLTLRKFHTFLFFHKYRRTVHWETQIKSKDSIQGAYLLLKRYKNRLKGFDETL